MPDLDQIDRVAQEVFHILSFRDQQKEVITSILGKRDTLAVFPTGSGKSILFQIPALVFPGLTLVVTPLISLMNDQVRVLSEKTKYCAALSSASSVEENQSTLNRLGELKILYVTPERLKSPLFLKELARQKIEISMIVVDEAHCVSLWGNSFRPAYLEIRKFCSYFSTAVISAFTATASPFVLKDIVSFLGMRSHALFRKSLFRENLEVSVRFTEDKVRYLLDHLKPGESAVLYCNSRYICEFLSDLLNRHSLRSAVYHAGLSQEERAENQLKFMKNEKDIIVATSAFGMGIDKPDIRRVIHFDVSLEIEEYIQEIGRAGRDNNNAYAEMLVDQNDYQALDRNLKHQFPAWKEILKWRAQKGLDEIKLERLNSVLLLLGLTKADELPGNKKNYFLKKKIMIEKINAVKRYISLSDCRMKFLGNYFGEKAFLCGKCDFCITAKRKFGLKNLSPLEILLIAAFSGFPAKVSLKNFRERMIGMKLSDLCGKGFAAMRGLELKAFWNLIYQLKNKNIVEFCANGRQAGLSKGWSELWKKS
jgi:RecQ family ATP-dependent DNA helicase